MYALASAITYQKKHSPHRTLRPTSNKTRENYGFPSVEIHMAVVVNGFVAARFAEWWASVPLFCITIFMGFTRVYSCARFVHQVVLSFVTGGEAERGAKDG